MPQEVKLVHEDDRTLRFVFWWWWGPVAAVIALGVLYMLWTHPTPTIIRLIFSFVFGLMALVGIRSAFTRYDVTFDLLTRTYSRRKGVWPNFILEEGSMSEIERVAVDHEVQLGQHGSNIHLWVIKIEFQDPAKNVCVAQYQNEGGAYAKLRYLSEKLGVKASDEVENQQSLRADETAALAGDGVVPPPPTGTIQFTGVYPQRQIVLPPMGFNIGVLFLLIFPAGLVAMSVAGINHDLTRRLDHDVAQSTWILSGICWGLAALGCTGLLMAMRSRILVCEDEDSLVVSNRFLGWEYGRVLFSRSAMDEVAIRSTVFSGGRPATPFVAKQMKVRPIGNPGFEVFLRSGSVVKRIGNNLNDEELQWLRAAIVQMTGGARKAV